MKATGIVRRIDDLGRVVIPREIRKTLYIRENDPLEIFVDDRSVIFRKYDTGKEAKAILGDLKKSIADHPQREEIMNLVSKILNLFETEKAPDAAATAIERKIR